MYIYLKVFEKLRDRWVCIFRCLDNNIAIIWSMDSHVKVKTTTLTEEYHHLCQK